MTPIADRSNPNLSFSTSASAAVAAMNFSSCSKCKVGREGQQRLRRVLRCFAASHPQIGYCQGLNFVAGLLLLQFSNDVDVLTILCAIVDVLLPPDFYNESLLGINVSLYIPYLMSL
jgi:hypothetical protein